MWPSSIVMEDSFHNVPPRQGTSTLRMHFHRYQAFAASFVAAHADGPTG
eukprot:CAMPEP_0206146248 /NCGR_PEP_ID=MMETSP1473-20131121/29841_1 /ASSEMBLY_ACC=CAM_ASM_001109 /TAXON_ID=1461547 /ORGANISM="Stichococcus sp, Strain RCC1054" /LENGTH=48 /DNA_ID= /DNA_START= /DNA_END= /DNA_ORIENTATION=